MKVLLMTLCIVSLGSQAWASEWFAADCSSFHRHGLDKGFSDAKSYEKAVAEAGPGSPLYVPRPFPTSDEAVVENVRWWFERTWSGTEKEDMRPGERLVASVLASGSERYEVHRVANWTPYRCNEIRRRDFFFLVRIFDTLGLEVARFSVSRFGLVTGNVSLADKESLKLRRRWKESFPSLEAAQASLEEDFGVKAGEPQYVWSLGSSAGCRRETPCIAFRNLEGFFLYRPQSPGQLLRFTESSRRLSLAEKEKLEAGGPPQGISSEHGTDPLRMISLGDQWVDVDSLSPLH